MDELRADTNRYIFSFPLYVLARNATVDPLTGALSVNSQTDVPGPRLQSTGEAALPFFMDEPAADIYRNCCEEYKEFQIHAAIAEDVLRVLAGADHCVNKILIDPMPKGRGAVVGLEDFRARIESYRIARALARNAETGK